MASDLLTIGASGARAARGALDVTAQNIANAATDGYVRRSVGMAEVAASGGMMRVGDRSLSGVRITGIIRNVDMFRQVEMRRTGSDSARATSQLQGLENIESAIEQARPYDTIVEFEASLRRLASDPTDSSLRAATIASADGMASAFNVAAGSLDAVGDGLRFEAQANVDEANLYGAEIARVNLRIARAGDGSSDRATLLDQRDNLLHQLSERADVSTTFAPDGTVSVRLGGSTGPQFVQGGSSGTLAMPVAADGTVSFTVDGAAVTLNSGSLAGRSLALESVAAARIRLDDLADSIAGTVNAAQANGVGLNGNAGQPLFAGTGAAGLGVALSSGSGLATAPAGSPANSTDGSNLAAMRAAFEGAGHARSANALLFDVSSNVASRKVTSEALDAIAATARIALDQQSGVDLDQEAANLIRFQQAFQASGRAMQVASNIFDTLIGIGR